mmetsp:Transcript_86896/g.280720  ORF Transcript_86896/g.280720 Transcript_86896/m.280720 type:complete len:215 (-) Transcript_86896:332-976(-)
MSSHRTSGPGISRATSPRAARALPWRRTTWMRCFAGVGASAARRVWRWTASSRKRSLRTWTGPSRTPGTAGRSTARRSRASTCTARLGSCSAGTRHAACSTSTTERLESASPSGRHANRRSTLNSGRSFRSLRRIRRACRPLLHLRWPHRRWAVAAAPSTALAAAMCCACCICPEHELRSAPMVLRQTSASASAWTAAPWMPSRSWPLRARPTS